MVFFLCGGKFCLLDNILFPLLVYAAVDGEKLPFLWAYAEIGSKHPVICPNFGKDPSKQLAIRYAKVFRNCDEIRQAGLCFAVFILLIEVWRNAKRERDLINTLVPVSP